MNKENKHTIHLSRIIKHAVVLCVVLLASYWSVRPLLGPAHSYFPMHDDTQVGRVVAMGRALRNGQFPVRWVSDLGYGYGYPLYNFYGPLPYYIGGLLYSLGIHGLIATKLVMMLGIVLAAVTMYILSARFYGATGAIVSSMLYVYAPYHAVDAYVRGAVGETWVFVFLPLLVLGFLLSSQRTHQKTAVLVGALGLSGVILSHTVLGYVTALGVTVGVVFYWIVRLARGDRDKLAFLSQGAIVAVGLSLSAFFWLPAMAEMHETNVINQIGPTARFSDHFVCISQLWNSAWGFGGSASGCTDGMSFRLGKLHIVLAVLAVVLLFIRRPVGLSRRYIVVAIGISLCAILLMLPVSGPLWQLLPRFSFIQYPWRFLVFAVFGLSMLSASLVQWISSRALRWFVVFGFMVLTVFHYGKLFSPQYLYAIGPDTLETNEELRWRVSKISDEYLPGSFTRPSSINDLPKTLIEGDYDVNEGTDIDTETYVRSYVVSSKRQEVALNRAYFPGWRYYVNGSEVNPRVVSNIPHVVLESGNSVLELRFTNTISRLIGNVLSIGTLSVLLFLYGKKTIA